MTFQFTTLKKHKIGEVIHLDRKNFEVIKVKEFDGVYFITVQDAVEPRNKTIKK